MKKVIPQLYRKVDEISKDRYSCSRDLHQATLEVVYNYRGQEENILAVYLSSKICLTEEEENRELKKAFQEIANDFGYYNIHTIQVVPDDGRPPYFVHVDNLERK